MKDVAVYTGYTEMLKRAGYRLAHLRGEIAIRIIGQAVILAVLICKFCLKKKIFSGNCTGGDRSPYCSADLSFNIVLTLVRRVESTETGSNCLLYECLSTVLVPRWTIHDEGRRHVLTLTS